MFKLAIALIFLALPTLSNAAGQTWRLVDRENGCTDFSALYESFPFLDGEDTPQGIHAKLKAEFPDAALVPFLEATAKHGGDPAAASEEEKRFMKPVTRKNAYMISSEEKQIGIVVFTESLCKKLDALRKTDAAPK